MFSTQQQQTKQNIDALSGHPVPRTVDKAPTASAFTPCQSGSEQKQSQQEINIYKRIENVIRLYLCSDVFKSLVYLTADSSDLSIHESTFKDYTNILLRDIAPHKGSALLKFKVARLKQLQTLCTEEFLKSDIIIGAHKMKEHPDILQLVRAYQHLISCTINIYECWGSDSSSQTEKKLDIAENKYKKTSTHFKPVEFKWKDKVQTLEEKLATTINQLKQERAAVPSGDLLTPRLNQSNNS